MGGAFWSPTNGWGAPETLSGGLWTYWFDATVTGDGSILVALCSSGNRELYVRWFRPGVGWDANTTLVGNTAASGPRIVPYSVRAAGDDGGNVSLIWGELNRSNGSHYMWANYYTAGVGWSPPTQIDAFYQYNADNPWIEFVGGGEAVAIWQGRTSSNYTLNWTRYRPGQGWSSLQTLATSVGSARLQPIGGGRALAIWANPQLHTAEYAAGLGWQPITSLSLSPAPNTLEAFSANRSGGVMLLYGSGSTTPEIWETTRTPAGTWSTPVRVSDNGSWPGAALADDGTALAVYIRLETGPYGNIFAARRTSAGAWLPSEALDAGNNTSYGTGYAKAGTASFFLALWRANDGGGGYAHVSVFTPDTQPPTLAPEAPQTVRAGELVNMSANATDDDPGFPAGASFEWRFTYNGSAVTLTGANVSFVFWTLGSYVVTLNATDAAGNLATETLVVTVVSPDTSPPVTDAGGDRTVLLGGSADFNGTATDDDPAFPTGASFWWTFTYNGTPMNFTGQNFSFTFWTLGAHALTFTVVDAWGNRAESAITVTVMNPDNVAPTVEAGADSTVSAGTNVALNGSATDNDPAFPAGAEFYWTFVYSGMLQNLSGKDTNFTFSIPGTYNVTLSVRDAGGNVGTDTRNLIVRPPDTVPPIVQPITDKTINVGTTLTVTAQAQDNDPQFGTTGNYTWTFAYDNQSRTIYGQIFSFLFELTGDYNMTLVVRDGAGNDAAARTFVVHVIIPDTTAPAIVSATLDKGSITAGETVHFTAEATDNGANLTDAAAFKWTFTYNGTARTLTGPSPTFKFDVAGTYTVTLTVTDAAGNNATRALSVTVVEAPPSVTSPPGPSFELIALILAIVLAVVGVTYLTSRRRTPAAPPPNEVETEEEEDAD